jgi:hypothetical protein
MPFPVITMNNSNYDSQKKQYAEPIFGPHETFSDDLCSVRDHINPEQNI